jgi:hypothetical protein
LTLVVYWYPMKPQPYLTLFWGNKVNKVFKAV